MNQKRVFQLFLTGVVCSLLLISTNSLAAKKIDFSGKWKLNETSSNLGEGMRFAASELTVTQEGNTITIERTRTGRDGQQRVTSETLTMDGKENVNKGENRSSVSVVTWSADGKSLTIKTDSEFNRQGETFKMKRTETWTAEEGGKVLKIQSDSSSSRGDQSATLVYDKVN